jgi:PAS domain S-box-containing protein
MASSNAPYLIPFLISALLSFGIGFYTLNFRQMPGAIPFISLTFTECAWTCCMILEILSPSLEDKRFWDDIQWSLIFVCVLTAFWFVKSILPSKRLSKIPVWTLGIFPILFIIVMATNPTVIYPDEGITRGIPFDTHVFGFGLLDWVALVYIFGILYASILILFIERRKSTGSIRRQLTWALVGMLVETVMYNGLFLAGVSILGQRDTAPFTFLVGNLIMGYGLYRYGFFDLGPMARSEVVENMPDAFILTDSHGKIVDMNRVAKSHTPFEAMNQNITEVFKGWAGETWPERFGAPFTQDFVRTIDGELKSLEMSVSPLKNSLKDMMGYLLVVRDITGRKILESALAESEERYRSIIESMAEGVVLIDDAGQILMCNQSAEAILGRTYDQIEGQNIRIMTQYGVHEDLTPVIPEKLPMYTTLQTGEAVRDVVIGIKRSGEAIRWLLINTQPFIFTDQDMKETRQVVISFRDVTEMRRMQAETTRAEIAQDRARLLVQFIQSASHEFRTPLAVIGTSLYMVTRQSDPAKRQHHVEVAEQEIKRIDRLLETLVNMVQLDSGAPLQRVPTHIQTLVQSVVLQYGKLAREHQIDLQFNASGSLPLADVEQNYLTIGIKQVLDNAIRYTPDGGKVTVDVTTEQDALIIKIKDTGSGIAADELEHIFDRFWRHDSAHSTPGFGLGLSIAQKVFERHDGTIQIESKEGGGTTVTMKLPIQPSTVGVKSDSPL